MRYFYFLLALCMLQACGNELPELSPTLITEKVPHDSDDPAIWVNKKNPAKSIIFGTNKDETNGGVYAFDLNGKIIEDKSLTGLSYPNNVDVEYGFKINDSIFVDILVFTEREKHQIRMFEIPSMKALDQGGFKVFADETNDELKRPMGISLYKNQLDGSISVIVSRKMGPKQNYLYQYALGTDSLGIATSKLVRKFGTFSGNKEIEAIAVDDQAGLVYYADEGVGIRKYNADPKKGSDQISVFGGEYFKDDIEGIAIATFNQDRYLIVSDQQDNSFNIFDQKEDRFIKKLNLGTKETDGCEVTTAFLGRNFPNGLFVAMNDERDFYIHALDSLGLQKNPK